MSNARTVLFAILSAFATATVLTAAAHPQPSALELRALKAVAFARRPVALAQATAAPTPAPPQHKTPPAPAAPVSAPPAPPAPPAPAPAQTAAPTATPSPTVTPTPTPVHSKAGHVFVVAVNGPGYKATFGPGSPATYLKGLSKQGTLLSGFRPADGADLPNYLAFAGGQPPTSAARGECARYNDVKNGDGCVFPNTVLTVGDQMSSSGQSWRAYMEGMGTDQTCVHPDNGADDPTVSATAGYVTRHDPFVYFHSLLDLGDCLANVQDLSGLTNDLKVPRLTPNLAFVAPDACNSGGCGLAATDAFLAQWVPAILASKAFKQDGVLVIAFLSQSGGGVDPTGALVVAPKYARKGVVVAKRTDPYGLLRSVEDLLGLEPLAQAADAVSFAKLALPLAF